MGSFGELGDASAQLHTNLGTLAKASGVMRLFATGPQADKAVESFGQGGSYFTCLEDMIEKIKEELSQDVALLVKGSRSQHMERVIEALRART